MALAQQYVERDYYTEAEYFEFEHTSFGRWEYVNGKIRQMSDGTTDHGAISMNIDYRTIASLQQYLLVEQDQTLLLFTRRNGYWEMREVRGLEGEITLLSADVTLKLSDVYALIEFGTEQP